MPTLLPGSLYQTKLKVVLTLLPISVQLNSDECSIPDRSSKLNSKECLLSHPEHSSKLNSKECLLSYQDHSTKLTLTPRRVLTLLPGPLYQTKLEWVLTCGLLQQNNLEGVLIVLTVSLFKIDNKNAWLWRGSSVFFLIKGKDVPWVGCIAPAVKNICKAQQGRVSSYMQLLWVP